jgi:hypothetical protein
LSSTREVRYTDGDVEAFVLATGELTGGVISYPTGSEIDVDVIYNTVINALNPLISILDNQGASMGETACKDAIGIGVMPKIGAPMAFIDAATFDNLYRSPWRKVLMNTRVLEMMMPQLQSRLDAVLANAAADVGDYLVIAEGEDSLKLPAVVPLDWSGTLAEYIVSEIKSLGNMTTTMYVGDEDWRHQFYTKGDLVEALLVDNSVDPLTPSTLSVLLGAVTNDGEHAVVASTVDGTGALSSINLNTYEAVNVLNGTINADFKEGLLSADLVNPRGDGSRVSRFLPNGVLYLGDCSNATAVNWINILRWLQNALPTDVRLIMERTGRSKRTLPSVGSLKLASSEATLGLMNYCGVRDGYKSGLNPAFNIERETRIEQEGPIMVSNLQSSSDTVDTTPYPFAGGNNWDVPDSSPGVYASNHLGVSTTIVDPPARFSGQWSSGRISSWVPSVITANAATGSGSVSSRVAQNLLSIPMLDDNGRYVPFKLSGTVSERVDMGKSLLDQKQLVNMYNGAGYTGAHQFGAASLEHNHLEHGFVRGLANRYPQSFCETSYGDDGWAAPDSILHPKTPVGGPASRDGAWSEVTLKTSRTGLNVTFRVRTTSDDGYGFKDSSGEMPFASNHLWDPTRSQITGLAWLRWAGNFFGDILPHPFVPNPIVVGTSAMTLTDINTRVLEPSQRVVNAIAVQNIGSAGAPQYLGDGVTEIGFQDNSDSEDRKVAVPGTVYGNLIMGYCDRNPALLGGTVSKNLVMTDAPLEAGSDGKINAGEALPPGAPSSQLSRDDLHAIPPYTVNLSVMNGHTRGEINSLGGLGNNATAATGALFPEPCVGDIATPYSTSPVGFVKNLTSMPVRYAGENHTNVGTGSLAAVSVCVSGSGVLPEGDTLSYRMFRAMGWIYHTYNLDEAAAVSPTQQGYATAAPNIGSPLLSLREGKIGSTTIPNGEASDYWLDNCLSVIADAASSVSNRWFSKGEGILSTYRAWLRNRDLVNPWVRGEGSDGIVHMRYDIAEVGSVYDAYRVGMQALGATMNVGLNNNLFLELQQGN